MTAPATNHRMHLQQGTRHGRLTGYSKAWCSCGQFQSDGRATDVARAILGHRGGVEITHVQLVIMNHGGLFGAMFDEVMARETAQAIGGVVVSVPITADYRGLAGTVPVESATFAEG